MNFTITLPSGPAVLHVCRDGDGEDEGWVDLYEQSFPPGQRQPVPQIRDLLRGGGMELDETRDEGGRVLCMTLSEVFNAPPFLLACYTATKPDLRSLGIGSVHRRRLVELLKAEYPHCLGFFSEIESTREEGLDAATLELRKRRLAFFLRLGLERLPIDYRFPSFESGAPPLHGELLWIPFADPALGPESLRQVLTRIYVDGYGLAPSDPFVEQALAAVNGGGSGEAGSQG